MAGGPLLRGRFFFGALAGGVALGAPVSAMRVDDLGLVAGRSERAARGGLVGCLAQAGVARSLLLFGLGLHHRFGALVPVSRGLQIGGAQLALAEPHLLRAGHVDHGLLGGVPRALGPRFFRACTSGTRRAFADDGSLLVDALVAQPVQGIERVAVTHDRESSKGRGG